MPLKNNNSRSRNAANRDNTKFSRDISLLVASCSTRDQLLIKLLATTGITPNELVQLKKQDCKGTILHVQAAYTKNKQPRTLQLTEQLAKQLAQHTRDKKPEEFIFSTRQSPQLTTRRVEQILARASKAAKVSITPRELRKAYLAQAAKSAKTDAELKELTGLKSITKRRILTETQQRRLRKTIQSAPRREQALITLLLETGVTASEAATLHKKNVTKTHLHLPSRSIPITHKLSRLLQSEEFIFSTRQSSQLTVRRVEQLVQTWGIKARIPDLTPSVLRATAIAEVAKADVEEARKRAGLKTPLFYTHGLMRGGAP